MNEAPLLSAEQQTAVRDQLARIVGSEAFAPSQRRQRFLEYIVGEVLAGRGGRLKGYSIATEVFGRSGEFDPNIDPVVRVEAGRLRDKLREYYENEGRADAIRIDLPKGSYAPRIVFRNSEASEHSRTTNTLPPDTAPITASETPAEQGLTSAEHAAPNDILRKLLAKPRAQAYLAVALTLITALGIGLWKALPPNSYPPLPEKASIAVLPFANIGNDAQWQRLATGLAQDIVTDLSQSKDLFVVARQSTEAYRDTKTDLREIGRQLGVHYILEGSVQPSDANVRVTTQLVDTRSGGTVWSTKYDRPATELFHVQGDVTEKIVATLTGYQGAVAQAERALIRRKPPRSLTAYEYYQLGLETKHGGASGAISKAGLEQAEGLFKKALAIDPQLARAYVGLAYIYEYRIDLGIDDAQQNISKHSELARRAVSLDPNDGEAQLVLGHAFVYQGLADQALDQFAKAEALAPSNADVLILIAWYLPQLNQTQKAVELADRAIRLNPNYPAWYNQGLRLVYYFGGKFEKSLKYAKLVNDPLAFDYAYLAAANAVLNNLTAAKAAAAQVVHIDPEWTVEMYLSGNGGMPDDVGRLLTEAAEKAGVAACIPSARLAVTAGVITAKWCDEKRAAQRAAAQQTIAPPIP